MVPPKRPNVIVFFTDQQRHDSTGVHGNPLDLTPNFDAMARGGTHLVHTFTCQPVCGPARSCLQTGLYATKMGTWRNGVPLPAGQKTLAHRFSAAGYDTAYIGKWHLGGQTVGHVPEERRGGYDYWLGANGLESTSDAYHTVLYDNDNHAVVLPGYRVDAVTDAAIRYIANRTAPRPPRHYMSGPLPEVDARLSPASPKGAANPFYMFISYIEPHFQNGRDDHPAPPGYAEKYTGRWTPPDLAALGGTSAQHLPGYYGMVKRLDEALGRLIDALRSLDLLDETIILFTSDHACHFKTRNSEYKRSCHESSIRVPAAIRGPGFDAGGALPSLVSLLDLPPTLLDACGIPVPAEMQGRSIMPLVRRQTSSWRDEVFVQISESQVGRALRTPRWKYAIRDPKSVEWASGGSSMSYAEDALYDLYADPWELNNLAGLTSHAKVAAILRERVVARMVEAGEAAPVITPAPERPGGQKVVHPEELPWHP